MSANERFRHFLETPGAWFVFTLLQVLLLGWLLSLLLPGQPSNYARWLQIALFTVWAVVMTALNVWLRRHLFDRRP